MDVGRSSSRWLRAVEKVRDATACGDDLEEYIVQFLAEAGMNRQSLLLHPSALLPVVMSLAALGVVLVYLAQHGPAPQPDEGAAAHLWQILMAAQVPLVGFFALRWVPEAPRAAGLILALPVAAAVAAMAPVFVLGW